jgi:hypothetical protein
VRDQVLDAEAEVAQLSLLGGHPAYSSLDPGCPWPSLAGSVHARIRTTDFSRC